MDGGIALAQACGARVLQNTIAFTQAPFAAIEWRFSNTSASITNNLVSHNLMDRGGSSELSGNLSNQPLALFVDPAHGNLHLKSAAVAAINQGAEVSAGLCDEDIDGETRPAGPARDVGADEYKAMDRMFPTPRTGISPAATPSGSESMMALWILRKPPYP